MNPAAAISLNPAQQAAVERWGQDVCVVAGPGSGKTRVLIERFRWLVASKGIPPHRILAVTFTEKAATQIKKRLIQSFAASDELREQIERAWVSTIHGFCTRLLKENAIAAAVDPDFSLLDEAQSQILQRHTAEAILDDLLRERPDPMRVLLRELNTGAADLAEALLDLYEEARTAGVPLHSLRPPSKQAPATWPQILAAARALLADPPNGTFNQRQNHQRFHQWAAAVLALDSSSWREKIRLLGRMPSAKSLKSGTRARSAALELEETLLPQAQAELILDARLPLYPLALDVLHRIHDAYSQAKRLRGALDFDDLEEFAIRLLESNEPLRARVRDTFDQVLMDELQDTNRLQWRLIDLVRRPDTLFAVGDINQSIYYFRHADPGVFRNYRDSLAARALPIDELRENYRSRPEIIEAVNRIAPFLSDGVEPHRLLPCREFPPSSEACLEYVHTFAATPGDDPVRTEARWIAQSIRRLSSPPARYSDFAILARTIGALAPIQQALDECGIPSVISGGRSFYESREIRDLTAWLNILANPRDEISLATVLRSPLCGISDELLFRLKHSAPDNLFSALETAGDPRLEWFHSLIRKQRGQAGAASPDALLAQALDESGYQDGLPSRPRANIAKFLAILRDRFRKNPATLGELTADIARWRDTAAEPEASTAELTNCVHLMSVHSAKGLEFPTVFLAAMRNGAQNREPVFCFDESGLLGATWRHPEAREGISDPTHLHVSARRKGQEDAEEDRLLYVAMTRAEERLIFTASSLPGRSDWARKVAEGLLLPTSIPKEEHSVSIYSAIRAVPSSPSSQPGDPREQTPVAIVSAPSTPGQHDSVVPVTSVAQFAFCPRQYYLSRYLGLPTQTPAPVNPNPDPDADTGEWTASEFGVAVHEILAGKSIDNPPPDAITLADRFHASPLGRRLRNASRLGREYDFLIELEGMILRGQIDLWFEESGELILVDYKSDLVSPGEERRHAYRYGAQLRLYALALQRLTGKLPNHAILWYLRTQTPVAVSLHPQAIGEARALVRHLREAQSTIVFPLREGDHCLRCAHYQSACPAQPRQQPSPDSLNAPA
ncbi:MAG: UvrD-helicase domain-containing protein [Bryobacterales bacterium]|nr:UvrD-helicase domain-containing protein [Bryobacterales bacterium]